MHLHPPRQQIKIKRGAFMKRSVIGLALIGGFLLLSNLTFAQDTQPVSGDNSITANQADSGTQDNSASNSTY